jgi:hypothetical protein
MWRGFHFDVFVVIHVIRIVVTDSNSANDMRFAPRALEKITCVAMAMSEVNGYTHFYADHLNPALETNDHVMFVCRAVSMASAIQ